MKYYLFLIFCCTTLVAPGQTVADTVSVKVMDVKSKNKPTIPMILPKTMPSNLPLILGYRLHDLQFSQTFPSRFDFEPGKMNPNLNLSFAPRKSLLQIVKEEPLKALLLSSAMVAGLLNNQIVGEDKMMKIRMDNALQSRSGIPESARSANGSVTIINY